MPHKVLLVDDVPEVVTSLKRALHGEGLEISGATSAREALALMERTAYDVVISDVAMPEMSGTEFLSLARRRFPDTLRIVLTGQGSFEVALEAINLGEVFRFLTKPCHPKELAVAVRHALAHKELLDENRRLLESLRLRSSEMQGLAGAAKDASGTFVLDGFLLDLEAVVRQMNDEVQRAEDWQRRHAA